MSNDIVGVTKWPDPSTGASSSAQQEIVTVNALGQILTAQDRNGNVHTIGYDVLGRVISDAVTTLGAGVDGSVRRTETAYDSQGNAYLLSSYSAAAGGTMVNQVQRTYNGLGQLTIEYQSHSGAVNTATTPKVQYAYSALDVNNRSRLTSMTYPNGRVVGYNYATGLDSTISRLSSITDSGVTLESYSYLGLGTVVVRAHAQSGVDLSYVKLTGEAVGDAGDQYTGLDRFGRIVDQRWRAGSVDRDRNQYTYDRDGNRLTKVNSVNSAFNEVYTYDGLNQVASFNRGSGARTQSFDYDALGNRDGVTTNGGTQTYTANRQNEITSISGATTPTYDANGNMTGDETGKLFVYDAWNRLVAVKNSGGTVLKTYGYDALNHRVTETASGTTTDLYYSAGWQVLEERVGGVTRVSNVWSPVYVDAMIARDRDTDANGTLDERLYVTHDANFNVTGLINTSGLVVERYVYDTYGAVTVLNASWTVLGSSAYAWVYLHQGGRADGVSGLVHFRNRDYSVTLGRWVTMDPIRYAAGDVDLYRAVGNNPGNGVDAFGLTKGGKQNKRPSDVGVDWDLDTMKKYVEKRIKAGASKAEIAELKGWQKVMQSKSSGKYANKFGKGRRGGFVDGRVAGALGGTVIVAGAMWAYDEYVSTGEASGTLLATRVGLGRALQILGVADELPDGKYFTIQRPDHTIHVQLVEVDGQWYFVAYHFEDSSYALFWSGGREQVFDIKPGQVPAFHTPGAATPPQDIAAEAANFGTRLLLRQRKVQHAIVGVD